ncbi:MAG: hypothetical protein FWF44_07780 [Defluviitaleaceae bacterium]|nr:hypothetical protein [Defluviitaleaceae bacterium]
MHNYAILCSPGHSRVYFEASREMAASELVIALRKADVDREAVKDSLKHEKIAGIWYLTFAAGEKLTQGDIEIISGLSFVFAMFEVLVLENGGEISFLPVEKTAVQYMDESVSHILKYAGKTNELFTRMMINIAAYSQDRADAGPLRLLDPVAGKGTTLYEGLIKGYDVYGVEIGDAAVNEAYHYFKRFLELGKFKHTVETRRVCGPNKSYMAERHTFEIARTKEEQRGKDVRIAEIIAGNSMYADEFYKKNFFDIIVGDLPYGVAHGNVLNDTKRDKKSSPTRNPSELLAACLPAWREVLKPGGAIVLAWNSFVLPRDKMEAIFAEKGFAVLNEGEYLNFSHRVDQAIMRDVIAARK